MKEFLKKLYAVTQKLIESLISIGSVLLFSIFKADAHFKRERNKRKHDEACHILCNGPSLSSFLETDNSNLENVFALNYFALTDQYKKYKPNCYIVLDNIDIGRQVLTEQEKVTVDRFYDAVVRETTWPMTFYYPSNGTKDHIKFLSQNKNITVVVFNMTPVSGFKFINNWLFKHSLGMPRPQNVSNAAIFCALNAGFKRIYLYGVDHSWMKSFDVHPETHRVYLNDGHFYEKENIRWFDRGAYRDWLLWTYMALQSHFDLRDYADYIGAKVINKTPSSFIEAYEFEEY